MNEKPSSRSGASETAVVGMRAAWTRGQFGVTVNAVAPGLVTTKITAEAIPEAYRLEVAAGQCLRELIAPEDVADAAACLAGLAARLVTGRTLQVNGGSTMGGI